MSRADSCRYVTTLRLYLASEVAKQAIAASLVADGHLASSFRGSSQGEFAQVMKFIFLWFVVLGFAAITAIAARWNSESSKDSVPTREKVEALADAVRNGLITQQEYEAKVKELGGDMVDKYLAAPGEEVRVATDTEQLAALSAALAKGSITRDQFDARLAEFETRRRMEADLGPDRPRVVQLTPMQDPLSANKQETASPVQ
jgi:hypothetical protein